MQVVTGHKGKLSLAAHFRGLECHSALAPQGVNAVEYAARLIVMLSDMGRRKAKEGPFDHAYDIPYSTVHTGLVAGGTALNIVPKDCRFEFEYRYIPSEDPHTLLQEAVDYAQQVLLPQMQAVFPEAAIEIEETSSFSALNVPDDHEVVQLAKALTGANSTTTVAFGTEAGLISDAGIPAVVCGPGNIEQAHKPDEFISLEQLALCEAFMDRLCERIAKD